jgi:hypothetical protein
MMKEFDMHVMRELRNAPALVLGCLLQLAVSTAARAELVTGNGEWESRSSTAIRGTWTVALERSGSYVKGTVTLTGSPLFSGAQVSGTIDGDQVMFGTLVERENQLTFSATLTEEQVAGEWQCESIGDAGSWSGTLRGAGERRSQ